MSKRLLPVRLIDYGLRDYGLPPTIWGGSPECEHVWGEHQIGKAQRQRNGASGGLHEGRAVNGLAESVQTEHSHGSFCQLCGAWRGCLGLEPTPELYVAHLVAIGRELRRVLREDGVFFLNLGDSFWGGKGQSSQAWSTEHTDRSTLQKEYHQIAGKGDTRPTDGKHPILKPKDLIGIPWRVALALQADGWYLRSDIIWAKPNPMPESVTDRPTKSHEYVFLLTKSARYFWDSLAVAEPTTETTIARQKRGTSNSHKNINGAPGQPPHSINQPRDNDPTRDASPTRNIRTVWDVATSPYSGAHFATWPPKLVEPMILAGTSARGCCPKCGRPWERVMEKCDMTDRPRRSTDAKCQQSEWQGATSAGQQYQDWRDAHPDITLGWRAACDCDAGEAIPCLVLDPFCGSGTTGRVAIQHGRRFIGLDLNGGYLGNLASERLDNVQVRLGL